VLAKLQRESQDRTQALTRLRAQQAELEQLLRNLARSLRDAPAPVPSGAFAALRGKLSWPVSGTLLAQFGQLRTQGVRWEGVVIGVARGAEVRAVAAGRVVYADWLPGLGLLAIIDHGGGYLSLYGHNDGLRRAVGDSVAPGEVIASAGDTGGSSRPELYLEIRQNGKPVDPAPWFRRRTPE
jgi:septal ring factor EnvC (AmiA/AmiB activator)